MVSALLHAIHTVPVCVLCTILGMYMVFNGQLCKQRKHVYANAIYTANHWTPCLMLSANSVYRSIVHKIYTFTHIFKAQHWTHRENEKKTVNNELLTRNIWVHRHTFVPVATERWFELNECSQHRQLNLLNIGAIENVLVCILWQAQSITSFAAITIWSSAFKRTNTC